MERKEEFEFDLSELLQFLLRKVWISVIAMIVCMIGTFVYVSNFVVPMYSATASIYIINNQNYGAALSTGDLSSAEGLAQDYLYLIKSERVLEGAIKELGLEGKMSVGALKGTVSLSNPTETRIIYVSVKNADGTLAARLANQVCIEAEKVTKDLMKLESIKIIDTANIPTSSSSPNVKKDMVVWGFIGFVLPLAVFTFLFIFDDRIKNPEMVEDKLGLKVIGKIPFAESEAAKHPIGSINIKKNRK